MVLTVLAWWVGIAAVFGLGFALGALLSRQAQAEETEALCRGCQERLAAYFDGHGIRRGRCGR